MTFCLKLTYQQQDKKIGVSSLPNIGLDFYAACLRFHTSTNLTAGEIHNMGLVEVGRIEKEMKNLVVKAGYTNVSLHQFNDIINNDRNNFYDSGEDLLQGYKDIVQKIKDEKLLTLFDSQPSLPLEVVSLPANQAHKSGASYMTGTADGSRPGQFRVNTFKFADQSKFSMMTTSLHEATPGHHMQLSHSLVQSDWPQFRKNVEDRRNGVTPSRFPINTAYIEGWALYSESLGDELGLYEDNLVRYGHLNRDIFRANRLVVDTGIHAMGWTYDQAVNYMLEHTALLPERVDREIRRYITWPGQATAYKIGQLRIMDLKRRAQAELGDKFDIKSFHQIILNSAGPLDILEEQVDLWMQEQISKSCPTFLVKIGIC